MKSRITDDPFRLALGQYPQYIPFARIRYVGEDHTSNGQIAARQEKWGFSELYAFLDHHIDMIPHVTKLGHYTARAFRIVGSGGPEQCQRMGIGHRSAMCV